MLKHTLILLLGLTLSSFAVTAMEIEGVDIPDTLSPPNSDITLVLNGAGIREKFFMDIYIGARILQDCLYIGCPRLQVECAYIDIHEKLFPDTGPVQHQGRVGVWQRQRVRDLDTLYFNGSYTDA